jgi:hypothetical protein
MDELRAAALNPKTTGADLKVIYDNALTGLIRPKPPRPITSAPSEIGGVPSLDVEFAR